ncbi:Uncharacterised protein [Mesomycoplasma conjunctivae]|uniref:Uncharacterized protein n=1 Tax=Mesomycoplasma conjunctivae (strain ATCC 25834 / NCTC 10147 / HRC/581) TaxID=572263 RepID=C5J6T2_MESCH|nr:hypothetical protein [Mesomycoplasma conjunctivae]CAT05195.1 HYPOTHETICAL PROTEIN MCJ_004900 [Mesomycoplasma conjunctivae]VEU66406.1 Uncharacterised protein [Mesomycoplasma conjunctivae]
MAIIDPQHPLYQWLIDFKYRNAIGTNLLDSIIIDYIEIARVNVWTQYYQLPLKELSGRYFIDDNHEWAWDLKTKMATLHLAATYHNNPDSMNKDADPNKMIIDILGDRVKFI